MVTISTLKRNIGKTITVAGRRFTFEYKDIIGEGDKEFVWRTKDYLVIVSMVLKTADIDLAINVQYTGGKSTKFDRVADEFYKGKVETFDEYKTIVKFLIDRAFAKTGGKPAAFKFDSKGKLIKGDVETFTRTQVFKK